MKNSYFPGCNLKTDAKGFEQSAIAVSKVLDAELVEMPEWNCCGTVQTMTTDNLMRRIAPVAIDSLGYEAFSLSVFTLTD